MSAKGDPAHDLRDLLACARSLENQVIGMEAVANAIVTVIAAERRYARLSYINLLGVSIANASLLAFALSGTLDAPFQSAVAIGVTAGLGAASSGLTLVPWHEIGERLKAQVRQWRQR
ncbi:hypothetical protein GS397_04890 [Sphingobium yanoikuyae]|jgi:hypothetical protein|uniref:Uncharacterized protein n=2 Tax=Sphingobium TaxID=165695 RepID=A0A6P1GE77_SPHYA|nr:MULTISPECIES: hypothetical protein [Sphingobium]MBB4150849.1 hypothetical protein [Sphingobium scionense]PZU12426.1 MAG: hypothetical protein DI606_09025 [Sphingobium sp.]QHD66473.1 hypothetical protein GS397_04890 [Sphingobium yanoikuyae]QJR02161.1 hypothetical protein HH800_08105 [Sphingobium yanoikuyae]